MQGLNKGAATTLLIGLIVGFTIGQATAAKAFDKGDWRVFIVCDLSHSAHNDPIVYPGQKGASHLHDFFGNVRTNYHSHFKYMAGAKSTCDTRHDRSAYWAPAIRNMNTGKVRHATHIQLYIQNKTKQAMRAWPKGFKVVSMDYEMLPPKPPFKFNGAGVRILFDDQCWDGVTVKQGTYQAHLAELDGGKCPASNPVLLPHLHFNIRYGIMSLDNWEPVSAMDGMSWHADFWQVWDQPWLHAVVDACLNAPALVDGKGCGRVTDANIRQVLRSRGVAVP